MAFIVLEMRLICYIAFMMESEFMIAFIMKMLELSVVITPLIDIILTAAKYAFIYAYVHYIYILAPACNDGEVQLLNDRVQICYNQVWGYVCEDFNWSHNDASVVCREVGLSPQGIVFPSVCIHDPCLHKYV